jgi:5-methylcytosine-specific restriction endonuclease McrA
MTKRKNDDDDVEIVIHMPPEERHEDRVERGHSYSEWKFKQIWYGFRCAYCGIHKDDTPEGYLTRDHIIPISEGGTDEIDNIAPACYSCNTTKGRELNFDKPRVRKRRKSK